MSRKLLVGTLLVAAATLGLVFTVGRSTRVYSIDVAEFVGRDIRDQQARVTGTLVHGTLCRMKTGCGYRFTLEGHGRSHDGTQFPYAELPVRYDSCVVPDTFRDVRGLDVQVSVEGERCQACHDFVASQVIAKSGMKYEIDVDSGKPVYTISRMPLCDAQAPRM